MFQIFLPGEFDKYNSILIVQVSIIISVWSVKTPGYVNGHNNMAILVRRSP